VLYGSIYWHVHARRVDAVNKCRYFGSGCASAQCTARLSFGATRWKRRGPPNPPNSLALAARTFPLRIDKKSYKGECTERRPARPYLPNFVRPPLQVLGVNLSALPTRMLERAR
jgi:hypothetical protein